MSVNEHNITHLISAQYMSNHLSKVLMKAILHVSEGRQYYTVKANIILHKRLNRVHCHMNFYSGLIPHICHTDCESDQS